MAFTSICWTCSKTSETVDDLFRCETCPCWRGPPGRSSPTHRSKRTASVPSTRSVMAWLEVLLLEVLPLSRPPWLACLSLPEEAAWTVPGRCFRWVRGGLRPDLGSRIRSRWFQFIPEINALLIWLGDDSDYKLAIAWDQAHFSMWTIRRAGDIPAASTQFVYCFFNHGTHFVYLHWHILFSYMEYILVWQQRRTAKVDLC